MCGIIGYTGSENVKDVLLDALELLEYRGYDSAGIAVKDETSHVTNVYKCAGRVSDLRAICDSKKILSACGSDIQDGQLTVELQTRMHIRISREK